jgi:hypothetical protein
MSSVGYDSYPGCVSLPDQRYSSSRNNVLVADGAVFNNKWLVEVDQKTRDLIVRDQDSNPVVRYGSDGVVTFLSTNAAYPIRIMGNPGARQGIVFNSTNNNLPSTAISCDAGTTELVLDARQSTASIGTHTDTTAKFSVVTYDPNDAKQRLERFAVSAKGASASRIRLVPSDTLPSGSDRVEGLIVYDPVIHAPKFWDGTAWQTFAVST